MIRFYKSPALLRALFPKLLWRMPVVGKTVYLTFDDGPIPEVTEFVLEQLARFKAKATFFCVGDNVRKHPDIAAMIKEAGHRIGNHTFNHLNGWQTSLETYLQNVEQCRQVLQNLAFAENGKLLLRPPYGKITRQQLQQLQPEYEVVMWDVLTYDFDADLAPEACLHNSIRKTGPGSVVVFHDSLKARRNLEFALPRFLEHFSRLGYTFAAL